MAITAQFVMFETIEMEGTCDACGAAWIATGRKQGGMNDSEAIICPKCAKPAGGKMHCAWGPSVSLVRAKRKTAS